MRQWFHKIFEWLLANSVIVACAITVITWVAFFTLSRPYGLRQSAYLQSETITEAHDILQTIVKNYMLMIQNRASTPLTTDAFGVVVRELMAENLANLRVRLFVEDPVDSSSLFDADTLEPTIWNTVVNKDQFVLDVFKDRKADFSIDGASGYSLHAYLPLLNHDGDGKVYGVQEYVVPVQRFVNKSNHYQSNFYVMWLIFIVPLIAIFLSVVIIYTMFYSAKKLILKLDFININLEKIVKDRTSQLAERNQEISGKWAEIIEKRNKIALDEKMATLGLVTAGVAEDISQPIGAIINFTEHSQKKLIDLKSRFLGLGNAISSSALKNTDEMDLNLKMIIKHNARVEKIVTSMQNQVRSKASQKTEENLGNIVLKILDKIEQMYLSGAKSIHEFPKVKIEFVDDLRLSMLRLSSIEKAIEQLFLNAIYAVYSKFKNETYKKGLIEAVISDTDNSIHLVLKDNGSGISSGDLPYIYQPFFTTKPSGVGIGLGLSITYDIVTKEHAGNMEIESEPGKGTRVLITL